MALDYGRVRFVKFQSELSRKQVKKLLSRPVLIGPAQVSIRVIPEAGQEV